MATAVSIRRREDAADVDPSRMPRLETARGQTEGRDSSPVETRPRASETAGVCGLYNKGNTCYMNSALQCLSHVLPLTVYMLGTEWENERTRREGSLTEAYATLIRSLWASNSDSGSLDPTHFMFAVRKIAADFHLHSQQDAQELMNKVLTHLHQELNHAQDGSDGNVNKTTRATAATRGDDDTEKDRPEDISPAEAKKAIKRTDDSIIYDAFHILLRSTITCGECSETSSRYETAFMLHLPLQKHRQMSAFWVPLGPAPTPRLHIVSVPAGGCVMDLCEAVSDKVKVPADDMIVYEIFHYRFHEKLDVNRKLNTMIDRDDIYLFQKSEKDSVRLVPILHRVGPGEKGTSPELFGQPFLLAIDLSEEKDISELLLRYMARYVRKPSPEMHAVQDSTETEHSGSAEESKQDDPEGVRETSRKPAEDTKSQSESKDRQDELDTNKTEEETAEGTETRTDVSRSSEVEQSEHPPSAEGKGTAQKLVHDSARDVAMEVEQTATVLRATSLSAQEDIGKEVEMELEDLNIGLDVQTAKGVEEENEDTRLKQGVKQDSTENSKTPLQIDDNTVQKKVEEDRVKDDTVEEQAEADKDPLKLSQEESKTEEQNKDKSAMNKIDIVKVSAETEGTLPPHYEGNEAVVQDVPMEEQETRKRIDTTPKTNKSDIPFTIRDTNSYGVDTGENVSVRKTEWLTLQWSRETKRLYDEGKAELFKQTIVPRGRTYESNLSLEECLNSYLNPERLNADNKWHCSRCKKPMLACKKDDLAISPPVLILHLKRFMQRPGFWDKNEASVNFPIKNLDMSKYLRDSDSNASECLYDLVAVCNHIGNLRNGHYTAIARNKLDKQWYCFNDQSVTPVSEVEIVTNKAYILVYERRETPDGTTELRRAVNAADARNRDSQLKILEKLTEPTKPSSSAG